MTPPSLEDAAGRLTELLKSADIPWALEQGELTGKSNRWVRIDDDRELTVFYKYGIGSVADCNKDEARARLIVEAINALPSLLSALVEMRGALTQVDRYLQEESDDCLLRNRIALANLTSQALQQKEPAK